MNNGLILWADDEIELLKAHIIFLEKKGYEVVTVSNGMDALDQCTQRNFDLIMLDEMMPGLSGLETLQRIKEIQPATPVVMCTKSEEENLIKPVNPSQILLTLKKNIHRKEIVSEVTQTGYQQNFQDISMQIMDCKTLDDWRKVYRRLVHWELELSNTGSSMADILVTQKEEANNGFAKYVKANYMDRVRKSSSSCSITFDTTNGKRSKAKLAISSTSTKTCISPSFPLLHNMRVTPYSAVLCPTRLRKCSPTYG